MRKIDGREKGSECVCERERERERERGREMLVPITSFCYIFFIANKLSRMARTVITTVSITA